MNEKMLAQHVVILSETAQDVEVRLLVLECAVSALVASSADPARFAAEFRRCWQHSGSQHSASEHGEKTLAQLDQALTRIEAACPVPLGVRPGR